MENASRHWNGLHSSARFRPAYPSEPVVRFLAATRGQLASVAAPKFLDVGAGAGRHLVLAAELGFIPVDIDLSHTGLIHARERLASKNTPQLLAVGSMTDLPFATGTFQAILSYGVFYYGIATEMLQAIDEIRRALAPQGKAFVVLRSTDDYRFGKGKELGPNTFQLDITQANEYGYIQHFLAATDVPKYFRSFSRVTFEKTETTFDNRTAVNSDWLITAEK